MLEKEQITIILQSIKSLEDRFLRLSVSEKIPQIEIDISLTKLQFIYEEVINLDKLIKTKVVKDSAPISIITKPEKQIDEPNSKPESSLKAEKDETEIKQENEVIKTPLITVKEEPIVVQKAEPIEQKIEPVEQDDESKEEDKVHQITIPQTRESISANPNTNEQKPIKKDKKEHTEKTVVENISVNDLLAKNISGSIIASKLKNKPIKSINEAIGLNDKFLFIRELFNGKADDFSKTVDIFNKIENFQQCIDYVQVNFQWDFEDSNVLKFLEIVNRRFIQ